MSDDNGQQTQAMKCQNPACAKEFSVLNPPAEVINSMTVSMVIWAHPDVQACPHCGTPYQMSIKTIRGVVANWDPVRTRGDVGIVAPPPGFRVPEIKQ